MSVGKFPVINDKLQMCDKGAAIWDPIVLITAIGIPSHPLLYLLLKLLMIWIISSGVVELIKNEFCSLIGKNDLKFTSGGSIFASNFGPIVTKKSLNLLLIS